MIQSEPFELEKLKPLATWRNSLLEVAKQTNEILSVVEKYGNLISEEDRGILKHCVFRLSKKINGTAVESFWSIEDVNYAVELLKRDYPDEYPDIDIVSFFKQTGLNLGGLYDEVMAKLDHESIRELHNDAIVAVLDGRLRELRRMGVLAGGFETEENTDELRLE